MTAQMSCTISLGAICMEGKELMMDRNRKELAMKVKFVKVCKWRAQIRSAQDKTSEVNPSRAQLEARIVNEGFGV